MDKNTAILHDMLIDFMGEAEAQKIMNHVETMCSDAWSKGYDEGADNQREMDEEMDEIDCLYGDC